MANNFMFAASFFFILAAIANLKVNPWLALAQVMIAGANVILMVR